MVLLNFTKGPNRMLGPVALPSAARALFCPLDRAARRRGREGGRSFPSRFGQPAQNGRKWRRKGLKQLNPRPEMVQVGGCRALPGQVRG